MTDFLLEIDDLPWLYARGAEDLLVVLFTETLRWGFDRDETDKALYPILDFIEERHMYPVHYKTDIDAPIPCEIRIYGSLDHPELLGNMLSGVNGWEVPETLAALRVADMLKPLQRAAQ